MFETYNNHFKKNMVIIHPGEFHSSQEDIIISTVLGSCISVVLYDVALGYCGMNHFMLPGTIHKQAFYEEQTGRYGINAMELLINDMLKKGTLKQDLQAKIFGGGHVINNTLPRDPSAATSLHHHDTHIHRHGTNPALNSIPISNIRFANDFLKTEGIPIIAHDTGGDCGRKVLLFTLNSQVLLKRFYGSQVNEAAAEEIEYLRKLRLQNKSNPEITLF